MRNAFGLYVLQGQKNRLGYVNSVKFYQIDAWFLTDEKNDIIISDKPKDLHFACQHPRIPVGLWDTYPGLAKGSVRMRSEKNTTQLKRIVISAMLAALTCVATMVIKIPIPATNGYINLGDCMVLLSGWLLGGAYGTAAAGLGSMLADILLGYMTYAPGTFVIKGLMAFVAFTFYRTLGERHGFLARLISSVLAEAVMVFGYFVFEATLLGYGIGAAASIPANVMQGVGGVVISSLLMELIRSNPVLRHRS